MVADRTSAAARLRAGGEHLQAGRFADAVAEFVPAQEFFDARGYRSESARCAALLALAHTQLGRHVDAEREFRAAYDSYRRLGRPREATMALTGLAWAYYWTARYAEADEAAATVVEFYRAGNQYDEMVMFSLLRAEILDQAARYSEAEEIVLELVRDLVRREPDGAHMAACSAELAEIYRATGRFAAAQRTLDHAVGIYRALGRTGDLTDSLLTQADLWTTQGEYGRAADALAEVDRGFAGLSSRKQYLTRSLQATLDLLAGRHTAAEHRYRQAREIADRLGMRREIASADSGLGNVYAACGRDVDAEPRLLAARDAMAELGLDRDLADCLANLGQVYLSTGRFDEAMEAERSARDLFAQHRVLDRQAACTANLGYIHAAAGRYPEAEVEFAAAADAYLRLGVFEYAARCDAARGTAMYFRTRVMAAGSAERRDLARAAAAVMTPAMVFVDATRFQFARAADRAAWSAVHRDATARLFQLARVLDDPAFVAELVESAVNSGVHAAAAAPSPGPNPGSDGPPATPPDLVAGSARLIAGAILPMAPPPRLRLPDGRIVLAEHLAAADARYRPIERPEAPVPAW